MDEVDRIDIAIDGADEVDPQFNLIKGGGAAHTREKIVDGLAEQFIVVVDSSKLVDKLGSTLRYRLKCCRWRSPRSRARCQP
jgi:ribose 5-phosphate isomerase A